MCSDYRSPDQLHEPSPSEQEMKKLEERIEKNEKDSKAMASSYAVEKEKMEARAIEMEQEARKERERIDAEHNRQLADLNRRLQDVINASATDRARLEQEARKERERAEAELADLNRRLQDATDASVADRATLEQIRQRQVELENGETRQGLEEERKRLHEQITKIERDSDRLATNYAEEKARTEIRMREVEQEVKKREQVEAEHNQQLADLNRRLQDMIGASAVDRAKQEKEARDPKERQLTEAEPVDLPTVTYTPAPHRPPLELEIKGPQSSVTFPTLSPQPTPYVQPLSAWPLTMADVLKL